MVNSQQFKVSTLLLATVFCFSSFAWAAPGEQLFNIQDNVDNFSNLANDVLVFPNAGTSGKAVIGAYGTNNFNGKIEVVDLPANGSGYSLNSLNRTATYAGGPASAGYSLEGFAADSALSNPRVVIGCPRRDGELRVHPLNSISLSGTAAVPFSAFYWAPYTAPGVPQGAGLGHEIRTFSYNGSDYIVASAPWARRRVTGQGCGMLSCPVSSEGGIVVVLKKTANGWVNSSTVEITNPLSNVSSPSNAMFGYSLSVGDANNDGKPDLFVGAPGAYGKGRVYLYLDIANGAGTPQVIVSQADQSGANFGWAMDFEDSENLLAVGANKQDNIWMGVDAGAVFLYRWGTNSFVNFGYPVNRPFMRGEGGSSVSFRVASTNPKEIDIIVSAPKASIWGLGVARRIFPEVVAQPNGDPAPLTFVTYPQLVSHLTYTKLEALPDMNNDGINDFFISQQLNTSLPLHNYLRVQEGMGALDPNHPGSATSFQAPCINSSSPIASSLPSTGGTSTSSEGPFLTAHSSTPLPKINQLYRAQVTATWICYPGQPCNDRYVNADIEIDYGNYTSPGLSIDQCKKNGDSTYAFWVTKFNQVEPTYSLVVTTDPATGIIYRTHSVVKDIAVIPAPYMNTSWIGGVKVKDPSNGSVLAVGEEQKAIVGS